MGAPLNITITLTLKVATGILHATRCLVICLAKQYFNQTTNNKVMAWKQIRDVHMDRWRTRWLFAPPNNFTQKEKDFLNIHWQAKGSCQRSQFSVKKKYLGKLAPKIILFLIWLTQNVSTIQDSNYQWHEAYTMSETKSKVILSKNKEITLQTLQHARYIDISPIFLETRFSRMTMTLINSVQQS